MGSWRKLAVMAAIFSFICSSAAIGAHPWPMYHKDLMRRGQSDVAGPKYIDIKWIVSLGDSSVKCNYASPVVDENGRIYIGTGNGILHVINSDGSPAWTYDTGAVQPTVYGGPNTPSPAIASDGTVYVLDPKGRLHKLTSTGVFQWRYDSPGNSADSHPAILPNGDVMIAVYQYIPPQSANAFLIRVAPDMSVDAPYPIANPGVGHVLSGPAVDGQGNIYVCAFGRLYKYDSAGSLVNGWPFVNTNNVHIYNTPVLEDSGRIILCDRDGYFLAVNSANAALLWDFNFGGTVSQAPPAASNDGYAVGTAWPGLFAAVDTATGVLKWSRPANGLTASAPSLDADKRMYAGDDSGMIWSLDSRGKLVWSLDLNDAVTCRSTPAFDSEGNLFMAVDTPNGPKLICLKGGFDLNKTVAGVKTLADGNTVSLPGKPVTLVGDGYFYIQDWDPIAGIRVVSNEPVAVGDVVNVSGTLGTHGDERAILSALVQKIGTGKQPETNYMRTDAARGGPVGYNPGPSGGSGINTVGLLVKTWGKVSDIEQTGPNSYTFLIYDGVNIPAGAGKKGLRVRTSVQPASESVAVTGVVTLEDVSGVGLAAVLRTRTSADLEEID